jgi:hypothetical protein
MTRGQATALIIVLLSIAISLGILNFNIQHIVDAIDMGKFMPFIYTGDK